MDIRMRLALLLLAVAFPLVTCSGEYLVGIGKGDITGPATDVNMLGYANFNQTAKGIHIRLYARAFIFATAKEPQKRVLFINLDACMPSQLLTMRVTEQLKAEFNGLYSIDNTVIAATHTHSSAAGYQQYMLYTVSSMGFVQETFDIIKAGILKAVREAHANMQPSQLSLSSGELLGVNINRSPSAYLNNPAEERARYKYDVDKEMTLLRIKAKGSGQGRGLLSWFPVHPTSMGHANTLLSGDNKGAAEQFTEAGWGAAAAKGNGSSSSSSFVAAFVQPNHADTSPNIQGTFCGNTEQRCEDETSTCKGDNQKCLGRGPAWPNDFKSTKILGQAMSNKAKELWHSPGTRVTGPVDSRHLYFDITNMKVSASNFTRAGKTCLPALGYSFAAGTTDGPGMPLFYQSNTLGLSPVWTPISLLVNAASKTQPSPEQKSCHAPKPILMNVGAAQKPYPWVPAVVEVSVLRIGNLVSVHVAAEFTTMAGRRLKEAVYQAVKGAWGADVVVVMASITNTYASYAVTHEEYQVQRYEGGSTLYGPYTADAYIQTAVTLAKAMVKGQPVVSAVSPPDLEAKQLSLLAPVLVDAAPPGEEFGAVLKDVRPGYAKGEVVHVMFRAASPRNNPRLEGTFLEVLRYNSKSDSWQVVHTDTDWCTRIKWQRSAKTGTSKATVSWEIPSNTPAGKYMIRHYGDRKDMGDVVGYLGESGEFLVY